MPFRGVALLSGGDHFSSLSEEIGWRTNPTVKHTDGNLVVGPCVLNDCDQLLQPVSTSLKRTKYRL